MAIIRASDAREKNDADLETDLVELRKTLMKIRGGLASGGIPEDVGKVREIKKTIARILTIKHERKLGLKREIKQKEIPKKKEKAEETAAPEAKEKPKAKESIQTKKTESKPKAKKKEEVSKKK